MDNDNGLSNLSTPSSASRKRTRENESESQRQKREKAAERQRRKRERDRASASMSGILAYPPQVDEKSHPQSASAHHEAQQSQSQPTSLPILGKTLSEEEIIRRNRVRDAARERQRKHRSLVKARKMRALGMDMGNEIMGGLEEVHYRVGADGQYTQLLPHELQHNPHAMVHGPNGEPPFPQGQPLGGQTFASTLLLSFSCAPLLKQHLMRSLSMTNEELASLEPIIAEAWDHWDRQRRLHYEPTAQNTGGPNNMSASAGPSAYADMSEHANGNSYGDPSNPTPNEFRARFHRPLVAPSPFVNFSDGSNQQASANTPTTSTSVGSGPPSDPIDPHLTGAVTAAASAAGNANGTATVSGTNSKGRGRGRGR